MPIVLTRKDVAFLSGLSGREIFAVVPDVDLRGFFEAAKLDIVMITSAVVVRDTGSPKSGSVEWLRTVLDVANRHVTRIWHSRRDVPSLDLLRVPDGLIERRAMGSGIPEELVLDPETIRRIWAEPFRGEIPPGNPRWLLGMAKDGKWHAGRIREAVEKVLLGPT